MGTVTPTYVRCGPWAQWAPSGVVPSHPFSSLSSLLSVTTETCSPSLLSQLPPLPLHWRGLFLCLVQDFPADTLPRAVVCGSRCVWCVSTVWDVLLLPSLCCILPIWVKASLLLPQSLPSSIPPFFYLSLPLSFPMSFPPSLSPLFPPFLSRALSFLDSRDSAS